MPTIRKTTPRTRKPRTAAPRRRSTRAATSVAVAPVYVDLQNTQAAHPLHVWLIVGLLSALVIAAWIWQVSARVLDLSATTKWLGITDQARTLIDGFDAREPMVAGDTDVAALKDEVLASIEEQLGIRAWPVYDANTVGVSIKYPSTWYIRERDSILVVATYPSATNTPDQLAQASISRESNPTRLSPDEWFRLMRTDRADYIRATSTASTTIPGIDSAWYEHQGVDSTDAHWVVYAAASTTMYTIDLYTRHGRDEYLKPLLMIPPTVRLLATTTAP